MCQTLEKNKDPEDVQPESSKDEKPREKSYATSHRMRPMNFEEALDLTKFGKFNYFIILISGIILNSVLMETLGISYVLPVSQCDMKLTTKDKGILSAIGFVGIISSSHLWGFLADTEGRRKVIQPTLIIAFTCTVLSTLTNNFWIFVVLRFLNGFFISGSSATVYAYLGEFHNNKQRGRAIMGAAVIFGLFCILLPAIAWLVINQEWEFYVPLVDIVFKPWKLFLIVCGLPSLIGYLALIILPESPKFTLSQGNQEETIQILEKINRWNNGGSKALPLDINELYEEIETIENRRKLNAMKGSSFSFLKSMWTQTVPLFKPPYLKTTFLACFIQFGNYATSNGMYMWFPDILNRMAFSLSEFPNERKSMCDILYSTASNLTAVAAPSAETLEMHCISKLEISTYEHSMVLEILYAVGFAFIGVIINAVGKLIILVVILAGCGIAGIAAVLVDIPILAIYMYVILLLCGLGITVVNAATVELYPTNLRAMAVCISLMMGRLGSVVGANVVGFMLDTHCTEAFLASGISLILCGALAFFIPNIHKTKTNFLEPRLSISSRIQ